MPADELRENLRAVGRRCLDAYSFASTPDGKRCAESLVELSSCIDMVFERLVRLENRDYE